MTTRIFPFPSDATDFSYCNINIHTSLPSPIQGQPPFGDSYQSHTLSPLLRSEHGSTSFPFVYVCNLLNDLDHIVNREDYLLPKDLKKKRNDAVLNWFGSHCHALESCSDTSEMILDILRPERRNGRAYGFDTESLECIIARALHLPIAFLPELEKWRLGIYRCDLGACVEQVINKQDSKLRTCPPVRAHKVSVNDIEHALLLIACHHPKSSIAIREFANQKLYKFDTKLDAGKPFRFDAVSTLCVLYRQMNGIQAKWLTRLVLKDFGPRKLFPDGLDLKVSFRLPKCVEQFALPERLGPGLLCFKSILKEVDTPPPTPPMIISNDTVTSSAINQLKSKSTLSQTLNPIPTPPTTATKYMNTPGTISKKRKLTSSYPNAKKRHFYSPASPPPLRRNQTPVSTSQSKKPEQNASLFPQPLVTEYSPLKKGPKSTPIVIDLTSPPVVHVRCSDSTAINLRTTTSAPSVLATLSSPIPSLSSWAQPSSNPQSSPSAKDPRRVPLDSIDDNSQSQNAKLSVPSSSGSNNALQTKVSLDLTNSSSKIRIAGSGECRLTQTKCHIGDCIFLLSPCIADDPWVSDNLLAWHGSRFTKSQKAFTSLVLSTQYIQTAKKTRKIILVDTKRTTQTVEFLKRVQMQSKSSQAPKQWIEVYDWRLLEYMAKVDRGKKYTYDPWDRCLMCTT